MHITVSLKVLKTNQYKMKTTVPLFCHQPGLSHMLSKLAIQIQWFGHHPVDTRMTTGSEMNPKDFNKQ